MSENDDIAVVVDIAEYRLGDVVIKAISDFKSTPKRHEGAAAKLAAIRGKLRQAKARID